MFNSFSGEIVVTRPSKIITPVLIKRPAKSMSDRRRLRAAPAGRCLLRSLTLPARQKMLRLQKRIDRFDEFSFGRQADERFLRLIAPLEKEDAGNAGHAV